MKLAGNNWQIIKSPAWRGFFISDRGCGSTSSLPAASDISDVALHRVKRSLACSLASARRWRDRKSVFTASLRRRLGRGVQFRSSQAACLRRNRPSSPAFEIGKADFRRVGRSAMSQAAWSSRRRGPAPICRRWPGHRGGRNADAVDLAADRIRQRRRRAAIAAGVTSMPAASQRSCRSGKSNSRRRHGQD